MNWLKKWLKQPMPVQALIFNYAVYLILLIATTLFAYYRITLVK